MHAVQLSNSQNHASCILVRVSEILRKNFTIASFIYERYQHRLLALREVGILEYLTTYHAKTGIGYVEREQAVAEQQISRARKKGFVQ